MRARADVQAVMQTGGWMGAESVLCWIQAHGLLPLKHRDHQCVLRVPASDEGTCNHMAMCFRSLSGCVRIVVPLHLMG